MHPDTRLSVHIDATCARNMFTKDAAPVVAELRALAGDRVDVLTESVGTWVGYFEDEYTRVLCDGLRELPGLEPWIAIGKHRRGMTHHRTPTNDGRAIGH